MIVISPLKQSINRFFFILSGFFFCSFFLSGEETNLDQTRNDWKSLLIFLRVKAMEPKNRKHRLLLPFKETNQNTKEVKHERCLIWIGQNNVRILGKCCLRQSDKRTNKYNIKHCRFVEGNICRKCAHCFV